MTWMPCNFLNSNWQGNSSSIVVTRLSRRCVVLSKKCVTTQLTFGLGVGIGTAVELRKYRLGALKNRNQYSLNMKLGCAESTKAAHTIIPRSKLMHCLLWLDRESRTNSINLIKDDIHSFLKILCVVTERENFQHLIGFNYRASLCSTDINFLLKLWDIFHRSQDTRERKPHSKNMEIQVLWSKQR